MRNQGINWNDEKNEINKKIHHLSFDLAQLVFQDPIRVERFDDSENRTSSEERIQTLGKVGKVVFVVYTERLKERLIISARYATADEGRSYYGNDSKNKKQWRKAD